jgi:predicted secreted protein
LSLLVACGSVAVPKVELQHHTVTLTPEAAGSAISIGMDQELLLRMDNDPVHSLRWVRDTTTAYADHGVLAGRFGDPEFERGKADTNVFGAAGFDVWRFTPKAVGQQVLRFEYRRTGTAQGALQTATFTITVH